MIINRINNVQTGGIISLRMDEVIDLTFNEKKNLIEVWFKNNHVKYITFDTKKEALECYESLYSNWAVSNFDNKDKQQK